MSDGRSLPWAMPSPYAGVDKSRYTIEKCLDDKWVLMSFGDAAPDAGVGHELDHLMKRATRLEGRVRIVRRKDNVVIWPPNETGA